MRFSLETRKKMSLARKGKFGLDKHPNWTGGKSISKAGYMRINLGDNHRVYEHRLNMERHLGRPLLSREVVHHVNGIKTDNRIENLELMESQAKHASLTERQRDYLGRFI